MSHRLIATLAIAGLVFAFPFPASANQIQTKTFYDSTWTQVGYWEQGCDGSQFSQGDLNSEYMVREFLTCQADVLSHDCFQLGSDGLYHQITCPPGF
jgi:hypothetical protein